MNRYQKAVNKIKVDPELINKTYQKIEHTKPIKHKTPRFYYARAIGVCVMVLLMIVLPTKNPINAETYISIDSNPSIQLVVDENKQVIRLEGYNDDGTRITKDMDYEGHDYLDICKEIILSSQFSAYINEDSFLLVSISNKENNTDDYITELKAILDEYYIVGKVQSCDGTMIQEAIHADMSIGKYNEYLELKKCDASYTIEDCKGMSIHEIHTEIQRHHAEPTQNTNHHGNHHD